MPHRSTCAECPTHICCQNVHTHANLETLNRFEAAGNTSTRHYSLLELNSVRKIGLHYYQQDDEVWITIVGFCAAFDRVSGLCGVHDPSTLPKSCDATQEGGAICPIIP